MMKTNHLRNFSCSVLLGAAVLSSAQVSPSHGGYTFRVHYKAGQLLRYVTQTEVSLGAAGGGKPFKMDMPMTQKVVAVKNGIATLLVTIQPPQMGNNAPASKPRVVMVKVDQTGKPVGKAAGQNISAQFPNHPIKIGETWKASVPMAMGPGGGGTVEMTYKFSGFKSAMGKRAAVLNVVAGGMTSGTGVMLIEASNGILISANLNMAIQAGPQGKYPFKLTMKRT